MEIAAVTARYGPSRGPPNRVGLNNARVCTSRKHELPTWQAGKCNYVTPQPYWASTVVLLTDPVSLLNHNALEGFG